MQDFTNEQLLWYYERAAESDLSSLWYWVEIERHIPQYTFLPQWGDFENRRDAFLDLVETFIDLGYLKLYWDSVPDQPYVIGTGAEQTQVLRDAFPSDDEGMEPYGVSWFLTDCPLGVSWSWPGRNPTPLFPGHNPKYTYTDPRNDWDGTINPEWEHWRFTPGPKWLDDFQSVEEFREFRRQNPNYYQETPRVERIPASNE